MERKISRMFYRRGWPAVLPAPLSSACGRDEGKLLLGMEGKAKSSVGVAEKRG